MKRFRLFLPLAITCCSVALSVHEAFGDTNKLNLIKRSIHKEPKYATSPKYSLIALGNDAKVKVWMVEDGKRLLVDRNANGDLTDDGPPIEQSDVRRLGTNSWDCNYLLTAITPGDGAFHTAFNLRRWNYGHEEDTYGLSLTVDGKLPLYAGWFGTFWSTNRETAPVIHFGGPFTPRLLRSKEFVIGPGKQRFSMGFMNSGSGPGTESRLSIEALPQIVVPKVTIEWPTVPGGAPLRTIHQLNERCCYWEFYTTSVEVPAGAVAGKAKLSIKIPPTTIPIELTTTEMEVTVRTQSTGITRLP